MREKVMESSCNIFGLEICSSLLSRRFVKFIIVVVLCDGSYRVVELVNMEISIVDFLYDGIHESNALGHRALPPIPVVPWATKSGRGRLESFIMDADVC